MPNKPRSEYINIKKSIMPKDWNYIMRIIDLINNEGIIDFRIVDLKEAIMDVNFTKAYSLALIILDDWFNFEE